MIALGIDIGGTRIKAGLVDADGRIITSSSIATPDNAREFHTVLLRTIGELVNGRSTAPIGVGIGCKGIIDVTTTRVQVLPGTMHYLEGSVLRDIVSPALSPGALVVADNDARVAMAGEMVWGAAKGLSNALMLTLGTGVGGGVVVDGKLLRGSSGVGGHIGHMTVDPNGAACICGNHGCLETVFSARAIESEALAAIRRGCASILAGSTEIICEHVFEAARNGDAVAKHIVERAACYLGAALAGLLHVFDPEIIILGGHVSDAGAFLFRRIEDEVWWRSEGLLRRRVPIVAPRVADASGVIGAAALVFTALATP